MRQTKEALNILETLRAPASAMARKHLDTYLGNLSIEEVEQYLNLTQKLN